MDPTNKLPDPLDPPVEEPEAEPRVVPGEGPFYIVRNIVTGYALGKERDTALVWGNASLANEFRCSMNVERPQDCIVEELLPAAPLSEAFGKKQLTRAEAEALAKEQAERERDRREQAERELREQEEAERKRLEEEEERRGKPTQLPADKPLDLDVFGNPKPTQLPAQRPLI